MIDRLTLRGLLVQVFLEPGESVSDLFRSPKVRYGIRDGVVVFQLEQWRELLLIQFLHSFAHVVREHEVEEDLLPGIELRTDSDFGSGALSSRSR